MQPVAAPWARSLARVRSNHLCPSLLGAMGRRRLWSRPRVVGLRRPTVGRRSLAGGVGARTEDAQRFGAGVVRTPARSLIFARRPEPVVQAVARDVPDRLPRQRRWRWHQSPRPNPTVASGTPTRAPIEIKWHPKDPWSKVGRSRDPRNSSCQDPREAAEARWRATTCREWRKHTTPIKRRNTPGGSPHPARAGM